jgi:hypothetical protein
MRRDVAAQWVREAKSAATCCPFKFTESRPGAPLDKPVDVEQKREMARELMEAYRKAVREGSWEEFDAILHEWSESGWAALNPELKAALGEESNLVEIKLP